MSAHELQLFLDAWFAEFFHWMEYIAPWWLTLIIALSPFIVIVTGYVIWWRLYVRKYYW